MTAASIGASTLRTFAVRLRTTAPVSARIVSELAGELDRGGEVADLLCSHTAVHSPLFGVQALAGVRLLMLSGRAPELSRRFASAHAAAMAGDSESAALLTWLAARTAMIDNPGEVLAALDRTVQQHQPKMAGYLLRGLTMIGAPRVRLLELGACAGLNLIVDRYRWFGLGWEWGDQDSPVRLAATGPRPPDLEIVHRAGCDLQPRNPADPRHAMILRSFIPPEHDAQRWDLDDAIELAAKVGLRVDRAPAGRWLRENLVPPAEQDVATVVWHSSFWPYLSEDERDEIETTLTAAAGSMTLARVAYESPDFRSNPRLTVTIHS
ncbi:hypothetical protein SAMN05216553_108206 [Lentzea fradiae]|uniref:DUF2332 domain-containing protein n=1 Tax=Lentzea fradiae TaxID=200378 RepID=A0A1G7UHD5_9PSEU|nr:DUF2332 family protein [Lentzea fradiae]SDG46748.1 hypothetical protein SAMN05216553_108206 [Lentzea fradiae]